MKATPLQQEVSKPAAKTTVNITAANPLQLTTASKQDVLQLAQNPLAAKASGNNPLQLKPNNTGLPDNLKAGVEALSGYSMDDVKVHYNSGKPAQLQALAYAQGTDIHIAPGQEQHLPHEAWHVVQQKQGRVKATMQMMGGVEVNDDEGLEREADRMGNKINQGKCISTHYLDSAKTEKVIQCKSFEDFDTYSEAKHSNKYAKKLLDRQKKDKIEDHFQKPFDADQQDEIYKVNTEYYHTKSIISDQDEITELFKVDTTNLSHIDHRFPKSRGGSNHYTNAAIIPANLNIKKSNKLEIKVEPKKALKPYEYLALSPAFALGKVGIGREFTSEQRKELLDANKHYYGRVTSDIDKKTKLNSIDTAIVPHVDHITAKSEGGTNFYFNAKVLPASENIQKSGAKGRNKDLDYEIGEMTLEKYYKAKEKGEIPGTSALTELHLESESESESEED